jgi:hypothetical protein
MTASRTIIGRWSGPTYEEKRAAWSRLDDAELKRLTAKAQAEGEIHTAALLAEEWIARVMERPAQLIETQGDPLLGRRAA